MCDADPDRDPKLQAALDYWASENDCSCVDIDSDTQFKRIWMFSIVLSLMICLIATLPFCWSKSKKKEEDLDPESPEASKGNNRREVEDEEDYGGPAPDLAKAKEHLRKTSATIGGKWLGIWSTNVEQLSEIGGVGTELYFRLLKRMGLCFIYMAGITCVSVSFNAVSTFAPDNGQYLARTTIGNIGASGADTIISPDQRYIILKYNGGCQGTPVTMLSMIIGWLDFGSIIVFIGFIAVFRFLSVPAFARQADQEDVTPKDYAVEIDKLPRQYPGMEERDEDGRTKYEVELTNLLEDRMKEMRRRQKGCHEACDVKVEELVLVRDWGGRLHNIRNKATLCQDKEIAEYSEDHTKAAKLEKKIGKITKRLDKKLKPEEELPVVRAFAIMSTSGDAERLLMDYRFSVYTLMRRLQQCMGKLGCLECCCPQRQRFFQGQAIRIKKAPEPTNIIWENQDVSYLNRLLRRSVINLIFLIIVLLSFALVYAANTAAKSNMKGTGTALLGVAECDPDPKVMEQEDAYQCFVANATKWTRDYVKSANDDVKGCYCGTAGYANIIQDEELRDDLCRDWLLNIGFGVTLAVVASGVVVGINVACKFILLQLAEVERPLSESALNSSKMVKIWALQTLNTGFVIFCVNFAAPDGIPFGKIIFLGEYSDAVRGWYVVVGAALLTNMAATSVVPALTNTSIMFVGWFKRCFCGSRAKHQTELIRLYTNPPFDIAARFAQLLTVVYVTLTYSAGLPLLHFFAALFMLFTYWADKAVLLWGSERPPAYDTTIPREASQYMLYSVALHCVFAIWMFGQPCTFPSNPLGGTLASMSAQATAAASSSGGEYGSLAASSGLADRLTKESTWMIFLLLVLCIGLWVVWTVLWILGGTLGELGKCIYLCLCPKRATKVSPAEGGTASDGLTWEQAKERIERVCPPASYRMEKHPSFRGQEKFLQTTEIKVGTPDPDRNSVPVEEETAKHFLAALKDEYVKEVEGAVGKFFESANVTSDDQDKLTPFEEVVRGSEEGGKEQAIKEIAEKWGLTAP